MKPRNFIRISNITGQSFYFELSEITKIYTEVAYIGEPIIFKSLGEEKPVYSGNIKVEFKDGSDMSIEVVRDLDRHRTNIATSNYIEEVMNEPIIYDLWNE